MLKENSRGLKFDLLGFIALLTTFVSILLSFNLSTEEIVLSTGAFLIMIAAYIYFAFKETINQQSHEIKKIKEKLNIYREINEIKAKIELLMNMKKRGNADATEILIRIIQIAAIIFAGYIILKALGALR